MLLYKKLLFQIRDSKKTGGILAAELYKTIIVGAPSVGKSSLVRRYQTGEFREAHTATIAADLSAIVFDFPTGKVVLTIVDVGGQETFAALRNRFYVGANHLIFVYDMTNKETFKRITPLYEALSDKICIQGDKHLAGSLVANKSDLKGEAVIDEQEGRMLANLLHLEYFETSARTGDNVAEMFLFAAAESQRLRHNV
ncbi:GTP-binding protein [Candidatus Thorarchaeota archaeon]|nr:MAG: GTP-binding protein [Candidatus Thorarchaeota archaeon]